MPITLYWGQSISPKRKKAFCSVAPVMSYLQRVSVPPPPDRPYSFPQPDESRQRVMLTGEMGFEYAEWPSNDIWSDKP